MDEQRGFNKPSPLRNSKAANRPFQSPLRSVPSPCGKISADEKEAPRIQRAGRSPYSENLTTPEKRTSRPQPQLSAKRICSENLQSRIEEVEEKEIDEKELIRIKERIREKEEHLEHVKRQLLYEVKHKPYDLNNLIERWLNGCQEALIQFQKDISQQRENTISITEILSQLGIPPELVRYSVEDCDFV